MRNIGKVSLAQVSFVLLVVMCLGSLPLITQAQGNVPQKVLFEQVVELPSKNVNVKIRRVMFPVGFKTPEHSALRADSSTFTSCSGTGSWGS